MTTEEMMPYVDRFATLDVLNTISENDIIKTCPSVQIVDSSNEISLQNIETIKSHIENTLRLEAKRNHLFIQLRIMLMQIIKLSSSGN